MKENTVFIVPILVGLGIMAVAHQGIQSFRNQPRHETAAPAPIAATGNPSSFAPASPPVQAQSPAGTGAADTPVPIENTTAPTPFVGGMPPRDTTPDSQPPGRGFDPLPPAPVDSRIGDLQQRYDQQLADQQRIYDSRLAEQRRQFEQERARDRQHTEELEARRQREQADRDRQLREQADRDRQRQEQAQRDAERRQRDEERNRLVYYECSRCRATITRRASESSPASWDGGSCQESSNHRHSWSRR